MTGEEAQWQSLRRAFDARLDDPAGVADAGPDSAIDAKTRDEVEELLRHLGQARSLLDEPSAPAAGLFAPGDVLSERYRIRAHLGSGGMGHVYEAEDQLLQVVVAVKTVPLHAGEDDLGKELLQREIRNTRRIVHSNVCRTFDIGFHRTAQVPVAYLTMERLRGETLAAHLEHHTLALPEALALARQLCDGLDAAHREGIVHGDLKPHNLMLVEAGRLVILDFGLSRQTAQREATVGPLSRMCFGTPEYLAPERFAGNPATVAADVYSLGSILRRLAAALEPATDPAALARWHHAVDRCLQPNPAQRPASAEEVYKLLTQQPRHRTRQRAMLAGAAAAVLLCTSLGLLRLRHHAAATTPLATTIQLSSASVQPPGASVQPGAREYMEAGTLYLNRQSRRSVDHAVDAFHQALALEPGNPVVEASLTRALLRKFELSKDPQWLAQAQGVLQPAQQHAPGTEPVLLAEGVLDRDSGHLGESAEALHRALALNGADGEAWKQLALTLDTSGNVLDAETAYQRGIAADPSFWNLYNNFGLFLYAHGQVARAEQQLLLARSLAPDNSNVLASLGGLYLAQGKLPEAEQTLQRAMELEPSAAFSMNLGSVYLREGKTAEAIRLYREACDLSPDDYRMWTNLGSGYTRLGNRDEAKKAYARANAILKRSLLKSPEDPHLLGDLALYSAMEGKPADARSATRRALAAAPHDPKTFIKAADMEAMLEDRPAAVEYLRQALELGASLQEIEGDRTLSAVTGDPAYLALAKHWRNTATLPR